MGEVTISVAGRAYQVVCEDGEEDRLTAIAARVDREAQAFGGATPSLSEPRLLLMCALLLADKLDEVESAPQAAPAPAASAGAEVDMAFVDEATARIEALASPDDEAPPAAAAKPDEQPERRSKSSAAVAAEKDLLSWAERSDPREEDESESGPADDTSPDPASSPEDTPQDEPSADAEDEIAARERADRRRRRRERLAQLASQDEDDQ